MSAKERAVVNAYAHQLRRVEKLVASGRYRTLSDFVREALDEKLARAEEELLADEVERYCAAGYAHEDADLVAAQAIDPAPEPPRQRRKGRRATR
jgi:Arc/MetJ-type ribon-helix-helix transcriptional regulator